MNLTVGVVRALEGDEAVVEVESTGCGRCNEPGGCGGSAKADLFCHGRRYRVLNAVGAGVGDRVKIAIGDGAIGASATRAYLVPLLFLLAGASLGRWFADASVGEPLVIAGAVLGLAMGWAWLRLARTGFPKIDRPTIVSRT